VTKTAITLFLIFILLAVLLAACHPADHEVETVVIDPAELESFTDAFFPAQMEKLRIPGVSLIVVQNGEIVLAKGYGYADVEQGIPVSPDITVMRIGSISKIFVATAVMQLVEQGTLDLDADVNRYLTTFQLADSFRAPVTLAHLLTHTAGFKDPPYTSNTDPSLVQPLGPYLAESMPPRRDPPGKVFRYSNHGYALAAYVVEEVSGVSFDRYVADHILQPLGMARSGYLLSPPLPEALAVGYAYQDGAQVRQPVDFDDDYPGGSLVSTATDMARFMLAQLQGGCYQGTCVLQASTVAEMHRSRAKTPYKGQQVTYGFVKAHQDAQRLLGHSGAIRGFGNSLNLLPEHNLGFFFSFNEECYETSACEIVSAFRTELLKRFFSD
jgi:CubicO group peptidase (beta-lactamase class C family)